MTKREWKATQRELIVANKLALLVRTHRVLRQMEQAVPRLDHEARAQCASGWVEEKVKAYGSWAQAVSRDVIRPGESGGQARRQTAQAREALQYWLHALKTYDKRVKMSWARTLAEEVWRVYGTRCAGAAKAKTTRIYPLKESDYDNWFNKLWTTQYTRMRQMKAQTVDLAPWRWR